MRRNQQGHWLTCAGIGCLVLLIVVAVGGYFAYQKAKVAFREVAAAGVKAGATKLLAELRFPPEERDAIMKPIQDYVERIKAGEVDLEQGVSVAQALAEGPVMGALVARGMELRYIADADLDETQKEKARKTLSRFAHGMVNNKIDQSKTDEVEKIIFVESTDDQGNTKKELKKTLTKDELEKCLTIMRDAADEAGIPDRVFKVDLAAEVRKAIDKGMGESAEGAGDNTAPDGADEQENSDQ